MNRRELENSRTNGFTLWFKASWSQENESTQKTPYDTLKIPKQVTREAKPKEHVMKPRSPPQEVRPLAKPKETAKKRSEARSRSDPPQQRSGPEPNLVCFCWARILSVFHVLLSSILFASFSWHYSLVLLPYLSPRLRLSGCFS